MYSVSQKRQTLFFHIFAKYRPIFFHQYTQRKLHYEGNWRSHHTLKASLHYLVKIGWCTVSDGERPDIAYVRQQLLEASHNTKLHRPWLADRQIGYQTAVAHFRHADRPPRTSVENVTARDKLYRSHSLPFTAFHCLNFVQLSRGSVATRLKCATAEIFNNHFIANFLL